ncbi:MAG: hypothetical protein MUC80_05915 [Candidatus Thermoplasmatota archaeon]|jgi:hypothetical protein|nr:hypothetical protein [Candidatus Thermoplasmatota archaeon]
MLDTADVTRQFIETMIDIIGRKTSQEYAVITIQNLLKKVQLMYPFLREVEIKNSRSLELEGIVSVKEALNDIPPKQVGVALKELVTRIMTSLGKTAGFFFLRETREKIGIEYDKILLKQMDVDLTLMQSTVIIENKTINLLELQKSDVIRRFLKVLIEVVEKQTSKSFALSNLQQNVNKLQPQHPFLSSILISDVRYTLGSEEIVVKENLNDLENEDLGRAMTAILFETDKALLELGRNSIADDLKTHLTFDYLSKLKEMGVNITSQGIGYCAVFTHIIKTMIDIIGKSSSEDYAIFVLNTFLRKIELKYEFLKVIYVEPATKIGEMYLIKIAGNIDEISETDARRAIQQLLETISQSLGENIKHEFIQNFKNSLDKKYLMKLEDIGVNFHMIELHESMLIKTQ